MNKDSGKVLIHGKEYETVASRVSKFRELHGSDYGIITEPVEHDGDIVVFKAMIVFFKEPDNRVIATGYAEENRSASTINRSSALENCETSAIGRALANFGMAGTEFASADEVAQAISQQGDNPYKKQKDQAERQLTGMATDKQKLTIAKHLKAIGVAEEELNGYLVEEYGVEVPLTKEGASFVIGELFNREGDDG